jgi:hypothetical protein
MKQEDAKKVNDEPQRSAVAGWDNEGGATLSKRGLKAEAEEEESGARSARRAAFDTSHDSSVRGEHRYADTHQTEAEQQSRHDRDALKRKLGRTP